MSDGKRVIIQIASCGKFEGHASGPFELNPEVFDECVRNFDMPVPADFEHASESDATSGTIPTSGAPAAGWVHRLFNRGRAGLWAEVEWLEPARTYIKEGRYRHISPAIRFGSRDRVTGKSIGARLSSIGIVNQPFLRDLEPLAARDKGRALTALMRDGEGRAGVCVLVGPAARSETTRRSLTDITKEIMTEKGLAYCDAMVEAAVRLKQPATPAYTPFQAAAQHRAQRARGGRS